MEGEVSVGTLRESLSPTPVTQDIYKLNVTCYTYSRLFRFCLDHNGNAHARLPISIILFACKLHVVSTNMAVEGSGSVSTPQSSCPVCLRSIAVTNAGLIRQHGPVASRYPGSRRPPSLLVSAPTAVLQPPHQ